MLITAFLSILTQNKLESLIPVKYLVGTRIWPGNLLVLITTFEPIMLLKYSVFEYFMKFFICCIFLAHTWNYLNMILQCVHKLQPFFFASLLLWCLGVTKIIYLYGELVNLWIKFFQKPFLFYSSSCCPMGEQLKFILADKLPTYYDAASSICNEVRSQGVAKPILMPWLRCG